MPCGCTRHRIGHCPGSHALFRILEEREDSYIIEDNDGNISHQLRTSYFDLKYARFGNGRIFHDFGGGLRVEETYNDAIFNAYNGKKTMQISDGEGISEAIINDDPAKYLEIFNEWYDTAVQTETIKMLFSMYPHRIDMESVRNSYVVDGIFMVDAKGVAHFLDDGTWKFLCIVASGSRNGQRINLPGIGSSEVSSLTMVIVAKIMFLLNPHSRDAIFFNQLPRNAREHVLELERKRESRRDMDHAP